MIPYIQTNFKNLILLSLIALHSVVGLPGLVFAKTSTVPAKPVPLEKQQASLPPINKEIINQAAHDITFYIKQGGISALAEAIGLCYLHTDSLPNVRIKCILEDLTLRIHDEKFRSVIENLTHTDPGPANSFLAANAQNTRDQLYIFPLFINTDRVALYFSPALEKTLAILQKTTKTQ